MVRPPIVIVPVLRAYTTDPQPKYSAFTGLRRPSRSWIAVSPG